MTDKPDVGSAREGGATKLSLWAQSLLGSSFFLLRKPQDSWKRISFNRESLHSGEVLFGKIAENVPGRHLKEEIAAQFFGNGGGIVPAHTMRNVVREIARDQIGGPYSSRVDVADVSEPWLLQLHRRETQLQAVRHRLQ